jgi:putative tricarboxylic transport membrane protein
MLRKNRDFWVGLVFLILGVAGLVMALQFADPVLKVAQTIGSKFFPVVVCSIMIVFAALLIITSLMDQKNAVNSEETAEAQEDKPEYGRVAATLIAFIIFVALMDKIGFLIMSIIYLPVQMFILAPKEKQNKKNVLLYVIIGVIAAVAIYYLFVNAFHVMLPKGIL